MHTVDAVCASLILVVACSDLVMNLNFQQVDTLLVLDPSPRQRTEVSVTTGRETAGQAGGGPGHYAVTPPPPSSGGRPAPFSTEQGAGRVMTTAQAPPPALGAPRPPASEPISLVSAAVGASFSEARGGGAPAVGASRRPWRRERCLVCQPARAAHVCLLSGEKCAGESCRHHRPWPAPNHHKSVQQPEPKSSPFPWCWFKLVSVWNGWRCRPKAKPCPRRGFLPAVVTLSTYSLGFVLSNSAWL